MRTVSGYALCSWYKETCRAEGRAVAHVVAVTADPTATSVPSSVTASACRRQREPGVLVELQRGSRSLPWLLRRIGRVLP